MIVLYLIFFALAFGSIYKNQLSISYANSISIANMRLGWVLPILFLLLIFLFSSFLYANNTFMFFALLLPLTVIKVVFIFFGGLIRLLLVIMLFYSPPTGVIISSFIIFNIKKNRVLTVKEEKTVQTIANRNSWSLGIISISLILILLSPLRNYIPETLNSLFITTSKDSPLSK